MEKYVDVILPLSFPRCLTYALPAGMQVEVGSRVIVPLGARKFYTAIIYKVNTEPPTGYQVKPVSEVLDAYPVLLPSQLEFWKWLADYYLCTLGDVFKAALPSGMKLESEMVVALNEDFQAEAPLTGNEEKVFNVLESVKRLSIGKLSNASGVKHILPVVKSLLEKGAIGVNEELVRTYLPKTEVYVRLAERLHGENEVKEVLDSLSRALKQQGLLLKYLDLSGCLSGEDKSVSKRQLLLSASASTAIFNALIEKQILQTYTVEIGSLDDEDDSASTAVLNPLNEHQQVAMKQIMDSFQQKNVCLLHGVTSSGKTEIYIHLIEKALREGKQVLYLLPEIALTTQITRRLKRVFGAKLGIYHSKCADRERVEIWQKQLSDHPYEVILGVRSSVFLPFQRLGLVIVDEEHENTYKQQDPAPRYHARNAAIVLASMLGAKTLLGTATPSIESWYNATELQKYGLVQLKERFMELQMPEIKPIDIQELRHKKLMSGSFSPQLLKYIREALENKEQVILFQNRRGYAPMIECHNCGWIPKCENCDVSLTYHKSINQLVCHYCGYSITPPQVCPACEEPDIRSRGAGTERLEDEIKTFFPEVAIARLDLDTAHTRTAYERIISDFETGKTQVLIGTQMISKGLDFGNVSVVGILNADLMLNYPDFRAYERAFQLMAQVAGRAGRKNKRGLVVLQTYNIHHPIIVQLRTNDYEGMVNMQLAERQMFHYPPYYRLIDVYLKHRNMRLLDLMAQTMATKLRMTFGSRVLGPDRPPVSRVQKLFIRKIVLKLEAKVSTSRVREILMQVQAQMQADDQFKSLTVYYDVDPM